MNDEERLLKDKLNACENVAQMFQVLQDRYDLESCKPGFLVKPTLIVGLMKAYAMVKPKLKL